MFSLRICALVIFICMVQTGCALSQTSSVEQNAGPIGDPQRGQALFESDMGCNICHGMDALGEVGPNIRQTTLETVHHALQNFPDMMNWQYNNPELFEEQALLDIVAYLQTLEKDAGENQ